MDTITHFPLFPYLFPLSPLQAQGVTSFLHIFLLFLLSLGLCLVENRLGVWAGGRLERDRCVCDHEPPGGHSGKEPACQCSRHKGPEFDPLSQEGPRKEQMAIHSRIHREAKKDGLRKAGVIRPHTYARVHAPTPPGD